MRSRAAEVSTPVDLSMAGRRGARGWIVQLILSPRTGRCANKPARLDACCFIPDGSPKQLVSALRQLPIDALRKNDL